MNKIIEGDCLQVLRSFKDESINLIVTSPPYADARKDTYGGCSTSQYLDWFLPISKELFRVLKSNGSFILNIKEKCCDGERSTYVIELVLALKKQGWFWIEEYIWHKKNSMCGKWPTRFRDGWEHCYHFAKSKAPKMFQDSVKIPISPVTVKRAIQSNPHDFQRMNYSETTGSHFGIEKARFIGKETVYPDNVLFLSTESTNKGHSAAFPIALPTWFIKLFSEQKDVVLDPFSGSGTTCFAAKELGRQYIGIELNPEYAQASREELNGHRILDQFAMITCEASQRNPVQLACKTSETQK